MKVTLEDFQILKGKNEFEFPVGITVIVGPNASGKSSTFYAIQNALLNPNGVADCINHNAKKTSVTIENNNNSLTWTKTQTSSVYKNNLTNAEYVKASKLTSRDIADLGFYFDNKCKIINIHDEWSKLFPYGESDTDMFRLFEDIFNISCSFQIIDEIKKDEQLVKNNIVACQSSLASLQNKQTIFSCIQDKVKISEINELINGINSLSSYVSKLKEDYVSLSTFTPLKNIILPDSFDFNILNESATELKNISESYYNYLHNIKYKNIDLEIALPTLDIELNTQLITDYNDYVTLNKEVNKINDELYKIDKREIEILNEISTIKTCPTCGKPLEE